MAKNHQRYLLLPDELDWQVWNLSNGQEPLLHLNYPVKKASEIKNLPLGDLYFHFPVRAFTTLPLFVPTNDSSLFDELAATHAERLGLKPDPLSGQLTDHFLLESDESSSKITSIVLRSPAPEDLPILSPVGFDLSPRAFLVKGSALVLWRELGAWVFAFYSNDNFIYSQATNSNYASPDPSLIREIRMAIAQLSIQGIYKESERVIVWSSDVETDLSVLNQSFSIPVELCEKPVPMVPERPCRLFPADVRAARLAAEKRRNFIVTLCAVAAIYLITIGYFAYQLWQTHSTTMKIRSKIESVAPQGEAYALHLAKWGELEYALDLNYNTVDILSRVVRCIPHNSQIRFTTADISPTEIRIIGEAPLPAVINQFSLTLSKQNDLAQFTWQTPAPRQNDRGWQFVYNAAITPTNP